MWKRVFVSGLLGGVVLFLWTFVVNGILGFNSSVNMKPISNERQAYEVLKAGIVEPGRYIANPELTPAGAFPDAEPVFSIQFSGMGHESAGSLMLLQLAMFFVAPMIGAWMLSVTSGWIRARYPRRVLFFVAIGLLLAVYGGLANVGVDGYPLKDVLILAGLDVVTWTLVGLAVAWPLQPKPHVASNPRLALA